jgi:hypothetical protein
MQAQMDDRAFRARIYLNYDLLLQSQPKGFRIHDRPMGLSERPLALDSEESFLGARGQT